MSPMRFSILDPKVTHGIDSLDAAAIPLQTVTLETALSTHWEDDKHIVLYTIPGEEHPRLNLPIYGQLEAAGSPPLSQAVSLDWDTPNHQDLTPDAHDSFLEPLADLLTSGDVPCPSHLWPTRRGFRLLYVFTHPIPVDQAEDYHRRLDQAFAKGGLPLDTSPTIGRWNTCHRLPHVTRDGRPPTPVDVETFALVDPQYLEALPPVAFQPKTAVPRIHADMPDPEEAQAKIWEPAVRGLKLTPLGKELRRLLQGRDCAPHVFPSRGQFDPVPSPRNPTIMSWAGSTAYLLSEHADPTILLGLFAGPVLETEDPQGRDLMAETWKMILYCWSREQHIKEEERQKELAIIDEILEGIKGWPKPPKDLPTDLADQRDWARRRFVAVFKQDHFVMQRNGRYLTWPVLSTSLIPTIVMNELPIPLRTARGGRVKASDIRDDYSYPVTEVKGVEGEDGGWLEGNVLKRGLFSRRTDIAPTFHPLVDKWLGLMAPEGRKEQLERWIGLALAFERGPIAALSLKGPAGTGKGMFVKGLAECLADPKTGVYAEHGFGDYQYGFDESPFLVVDEGWDRAPRGQSIDARFRAMIGGGRVSVNKKYEAPTTVETSFRVILTANNLGLVQELFRRKDMSEDDRKALSQRIVHMTCPEAAAKWLAAKGGRAFTAGWIKDNGVPSRHILAKHFLFLYEKHGQSGGASRFLMEGDDTSAFFWLLTLNETATEVGETLCHMHKAGMMDKEGWLKPSEVRSYHQRSFQHTTGTVLTLKSTGTALNFFAGPRDPRRGRQVNLDRLSQFAEHYGLQLAKEKK